VNSVSGKVFPTINPATGEKITDVQEGDKVSYAIHVISLNNGWTVKIMLIYMYFDLSIGVACTVVCACNGLLNCMNTL